MALRAAAATKSQLRRKLLRHISRSGRSWLGRRSHGELVDLAGRGLDALDPVLRALPAAARALGDRSRGGAGPHRRHRISTSAVTIAVTLPLIPIFMALIGWHTQARTERQWKLLTRSRGPFPRRGRGSADPEGLRPGQGAGGDHPAGHGGPPPATMATLRITFLSSLVLELIATLSTALVAVEVGLRLLAGQPRLRVGLLVLLLAPEVYLPLRAVGMPVPRRSRGGRRRRRCARHPGDPMSCRAESPARQRESCRDRSARQPSTSTDVTVRYPGRDEPALKELRAHASCRGSTSRSSVRAAPARARCSRCCSASSSRRGGGAHRRRRPARTR